MSIVVGYPRTTSDAELERIIEADMEKAWENAQPEAPVKEVPQMRKLDENQTIEAFAGCSTAVMCMDHSLNWIATTIERAKGTAEADKLASVYDTLSDLRYEVNKIKEGWDI